MFGKVLFVLSTLLAVTFSQTVDKTLIELSIGEDVVEASIQKIHSSEIFPDDRNFLRRIAWVETRFGQDNDTFRNGLHGGIWNVNLTKFELTKTDPALEEFRVKIQNRIHVDWQDLDWRSLLKPFYSALAARLYLQSVSKGTALPELIDSQAKFWLQHYTTSTVDETSFIQVTRKSETIEKSHEKMDLMISMDSSGSIRSGPYEQAKEAAILLVSPYEKNATNIGFNIFGTNVEEIFALTNTLTIDQIKEKIKNCRYDSGGTNTHDGLLNAFENFKKLPADPERIGVPRVLIVFTDGDWSYSDPAPLAQEMCQANITIFAIGIGSGIKQNNLLELACNKQEYVVQTDSYETLVERIFSLAQKTTKVAQILVENITNTETFNPKEKRFYEVPITEKGITLTINRVVADSGDQSGGATGHGGSDPDEPIGFYSYTVKSPSSALHDGVITYGHTYIPPPPASNEAGSTGGAGSTASGGGGSDGSAGHKLYVVMQDQTKEEPSKPADGTDQGGDGSDPNVPKPVPPPQRATLLFQTGDVFQLTTEPPNPRQPELDAAAKGMCLFKGTCETKSNIVGDVSVPCVEEHDPEYVSDWKTLEIVKAMCPELLSNDTDKDTLLCCNDNQIKELYESFLILNKLGMARCPSCAHNFRINFCQMTCSPRQKEFLTVTGTEDLADGRKLVKSIDYHITESYAEELYQSCKDIQGVGEGQKVLDLMCGKWGRNCTGKRWLNFLGESIEQGGEAPFQINYQYHPRPETVVLNGKEIAPMNVRTYKCSEGPPGSPPCGCKDCEDSCPATETPTEEPATEINPDDKKPDSTTESAATTEPSDPVEPADTESTFKFPAPTESSENERGHGLAIGLGIGMFLVGIIFGTVVIAFVMSRKAKKLAAENSAGQNFSANYSRNGPNGEASAKIDKVV